jgi:hypothetical protein
MPRPSFGSTGGNWLDKTPAERHASMTWMQRLKRVINIDPEAAPSRSENDVSGGIIASPENVMENSSC